MSLDKFKSIKTTLDIPTDADYSKKLAALPETKHKKPIIATLSTVAAVLVVAVAVGMWAIIGRGVRNSGNLKPPASETQTYAITDEIKTQLQDLYMEHMLFNVDDFDKDNPLTAEQIVTYLTDLNHDIIYDSLTREEFAQFAKDIFNYDMEIPEDIHNVVPSMLSNAEHISPDPIDLRVTDGVVTVTYQSALLHQKDVSFNLTDDNKFDYFVSIKTKVAGDITMTDYVKLSLKNLYTRHYMFLLDDFDKDNPLTVEQVLKYCEDSNWEKYDFDLTREEFAQFAKDIFNYDMEIPEDIISPLNYVTSYCGGNPEPVSISVNDGIVTVKYEDWWSSETVCYKHAEQDPFELDYFISFKTVLTEDQPDNSKKTMLDIAKEYHFDRIHPFEEGTLPDYVRYHVSAFIEDGKIQQFYNKKGGMFLGIPLDDYNEAVIRLYGKSDMEDKEPVDFSDQTAYMKYADLVRLENGEVYVALEIGGGLEPDYRILEHTVNGDRVTVKYMVYEIGTDYDSYTPDTNILTYTSDDGLTPKQFISCLVATSEPLAPKDDEEYISEPEFLSYIPHYAFDVEYDAEDYAWAEDGMLSKKMTRADLYDDLWTFIKKYHFYGIEVKDFVVLDEQSETTFITRAEAEDILKRLDKVMTPDNISLRFQSGNRCTIDGVEADYFETVAFFEIAKVTKVEYNAERPKDCHVLNITRVYGPTETGDYVNENIYFTENQVYWNKCLYTVNDDYFTGILK